MRLLHFIMVTIKERKEMPSWVKMEKIWNTDKWLMRLLIGTRTWKLAVFSKVNRFIPYDLAIPFIYTPCSTTYLYSSKDMYKNVRSSVYQTAKTKTANMTTGSKIDKLNLH